MTSRDIPEWLNAALARRLDAAPREPLQQAHRRLSEVYRSGGHSNVAVRTDEDAHVYALVRMPATYAACAAVFERIAEADPDFDPSSVLDIGAGPGTASFAALDRWPGCTSIAMHEPHPLMARLATTFANCAPSNCRFVVSSAGRFEPTDRPLDLAVVSYVLTEQDDRSAMAITDAVLKLYSRYSVFIEPGTRRGYQRLMATRAIAAKAGRTILAPCPTDARCPLAGEDWCHFKVRLNRRKEHRLIKGADAPFEDEPYSYLVISRVKRRATGYARLLRPPEVAKPAVTVTLCTSTGLEERTIPRRNKAAYKAAKRWSAGDAVPPQAPPTAREESNQ